MSKICFVSVEIHPATRGGCGVLLHSSAHILLQRGHEVIFMLDMPQSDFAKFDPNAYASPHRCRAYRVDDLCTDIPIPQAAFPSFWLWNAYRFHWAAQKLVALERPDVVEFFDYGGPAYYALSAKVTQSAYRNTCLAVRLHSSNQLLNMYEPCWPLTSDYYLVYALEQGSLRLAETILFPSPAYLNEVYRPHYAPWLGLAVRSSPALVGRVTPVDQGKEKDVILFYAKLSALKGVDLFVDAAVRLLAEPDHRHLRFVLAGYDPHIAPDGGPTYRDYLLRRIPREYARQFQFMGQVSWGELAHLLGQVCFAVFPTYLESFCYSAHELRAAGVPVIVNNIPGLRGYFRDRINALVFDGTVKDLTDQMKALLRDQELRERIRRPRRLSSNPLGSFYEGPFEPTWIRLDSGPVSRPLPLVCILADGKHAVDETVQSVSAQGVGNVRLIVLKPLGEAGDAASGALWFLGSLYAAADAAGNPVNAVSIRTEDALLIMQAGDVVRRPYLSTCLEVLARQPELSFVGSWKRVRGQNGVRWDTFPIDAALELVPFHGLPLLNRVVMRTDRGTLLQDVFDPRLMGMGEVGYLWDLETTRGPGVLIPEFLVERHENDLVTSTGALLSYLVSRDSSKERKTRLTNYLVALRSPRYSSRLCPSEATLAEELLATVEALKRSKIGQVAARYPFVLTAIKRMLRRSRRRRGP